MLASDPPRFQHDQGFLDNDKAAQTETQVLILAHGHRALSAEVPI
jgi:hypothetical protein